MSEELTAAEKKAARLAKMKAKLNSVEVQEFKAEQTKIVTRFGELLPPYDEDGFRQGNWTSEKYKFGEWYYDINDNPVFLNPSKDGDEIGDLYNEDSTPYTDFKLDKKGNLISFILLNSKGEYFQFLPRFELIYPDNDNNNITNNKSK